MARDLTGDEKAANGPLPGGLSVAGAEHRGSASIASLGDDRSISTDRRTILARITGRPSFDARRSNAGPLLRRGMSARCAPDRPDLRASADRHRGRTGHPYQAARRALSLSSFPSLTVTALAGLGLAVVGRFVGRVPTIPLCDVCFLRIYVWHLCR